MSTIIIILICYFGFEFFKYIHPHFGKHLRGEFNPKGVGLFTGRRVDIVNLIDFKNCGCTPEDILNFKKSQKQKLIILAYILFFIILLIVFVLVTHVSTFAT